MALVKMRGGRYMLEVFMEIRDERIIFKFDYNDYLKNRIKLMAGARWNPENKEWSAINNMRNLFQVSYLLGHNPYARYDQPLLEINPPDRACFKCKYGEPKKNCRLCYGTGWIKPYDHQIDMFRHIITRKQCIIAGQLGVGKTLAAIDALDWAYENEGVHDIIYVAPRSALAAVQLEWKRWVPKVKPRFVTYEGLKKIVESGVGTPQAIIFDESQRIKTPTAQRSQSARLLADDMRLKYEKNCYVVLLTGTPSPKSPLDWYNQVETACVPRDTWVLTSDGSRQVGDLVGKPFKAIVNGLEYSASGFYESGYKEVFEVTTYEGYKLRATADHLISTPNLGWAKLSDLGQESVIDLHNHGTDQEWGGSNSGTYEDGYILGWLFGDGTISKRNNGKFQNYLRFHKSDYSVLNYILGILHDSSVHYNEIPKCYTISSHILNALVEKYGLDENKEFNSYIEEASSDFHSGLLSGFFDADGSFDSRMLELSQSNLLRLEFIQRVLLNFGVKSRISKLKNRTHVFKGKECKVKDKYKLRITKITNFICFRDRVGFKINYKNMGLDAIINKAERKIRNEDFTATIKSIESVGKQHVYDCSVKDVECFAANGVKVHNCPGYFSEGTYDKFKYNIALIKNEETPIGQSFPKLITYYDDEKKCKECGQLENALCHDIVAGSHLFVSSVNEVQRLYKRMNGMTLVKLKSQCLSLPEMRYEVIRVKPSQSILNAAELITAKSARAIQALTLMRELSDGFQYSMIEEGIRTCTLCSGTGEVNSLIAPTYAERLCPFCDNALEEGIAICGNCDNFVGDLTSDLTPIPEPVKGGMVVCPNCEGSGNVPKKIRKTIEVESPKDQIIIDALDEHEDVSRIVLYASFRGSINKLVKLCKKQKWTTIKVDGSGWESDISTNDVEMISAFQDSEQERIAFIAHPKSGGLGLTLTASPTTIFYSNGFNGEDREQAEGRIHRIGMDLNRGAEIRDIFHLPVDEYIMQNLAKKRRLQDISMGMLNNEIKPLYTRRVEDE